MSVPTVLAIISKGGEAVARFNAWRKRQQGGGALLIEELKDNLIHLDMVAKGHTPLNNVVDYLSIAQYRALLGTKFSFNSLQRKRLADYPSLQGTDMASWPGKTTEQLIKSIYEKVNDLKIRYRTAGETANYQWGRRVHSIRKRIWLLLKQIEE